MDHELNLRFKSISHQAIVSRQSKYQLIICLVYFNGVVFELKSCCTELKASRIAWLGTRQNFRFLRLRGSWTLLTCRSWMFLLRLQEPKIVKEISWKHLDRQSVVESISPPNPLWWEDREHVCISCKHLDRDKRCQTFRIPICRGLLNFEMVHACNWENGQSMHGLALIFKSPCVKKSNAIII